MIFWKANHSTQVSDNSEGIPREVVFPDSERNIMKQQMSGTSQIVKKLSPHSAMKAYKRVWIGGGGPHVG